ncbi:MAG: hypothetical protein KF861_18830, partial [Planctomycetaceae bacterium]|nr:hypothetical protein [Planctomycetaceae bacterium]
MLTKLKMLFLVARNGEFAEIIQELKRRFWSTEVSFCLRRDLAEPFEAPRARVPFTIRELRPGDLANVLKERPRRLPMLNRHVPTCYVAESEQGEISYMQWLIGATANDAIRDVFAGCVPPLERDEALMEFAYTFTNWRGKN